MTGRLRLEDAALAAAGSSLGRAAADLREVGTISGAAARPLPTLTGAGEQVRLYLLGLAQAHTVLAQGADAASRATAVLLRRSTELDGQADRAAAGGAVAGHERGRGRK